MGETGERPPSPGGQAPGTKPGGQCPGTKPGGQCPGGKPGGKLRGPNPGGQCPGANAQGTKSRGDQIPGDQIPGDQIPGDQIPGDQIPGGGKLRRPSSGGLAGAEPRGLTRGNLARAAVSGEPNPGTLPGGRVRETNPMSHARTTPKPPHDGPLYAHKPPDHGAKKQTDAHPSNPQSQHTTRRSNIRHFWKEGRKRNENSAS